MALKDIKGARWSELFFKKHDNINIPYITKTPLFCFRAMNLKSVEQVPKFQLPHASVSELAVHPDGQVSVRALDETLCMNQA